MQDYRQGDYHECSKVAKNPKWVALTAPAVTTTIAPTTTVAATTTTIAALKPIVTFLRAGALLPRHQ